MSVVVPEADGPEILDACCGGRMWWWDKAHPLAVYMDIRIDPPGSSARRPNWSRDPDVLGDFRAMPFADSAFELVVFDPPHVIRKEPRGEILLRYGALPRDTEQDDIRRGFQECWRVLAPGGSLVFKWAGSPDRVTPHFPAVPIVGTRALRKASGLGSRWYIFYKPRTSTTTDFCRSPKSLPAPAAVPVPDTRPDNQDLGGKQSLPCGGES